MARNGGTKTAVEPNELYDTLDDTGQQVWDLIGRMGFRPDKDEENRWFALAVTGDKKIGPKPTLSDLAEAVQEAVNSSDDADNVMKIPADSKGNRYFEGMEPVVDAEIAAAAGKYHSIKMERCELSRQETVAKDELAEVCHRKLGLFKADPDNTKERIYKVGDLVIRIANEVKEKISTEIVDAES